MDWDFSTPGEYVYEGLSTGDLVFIDLLSSPSATALGKFVVTSFRDVVGEDMYRIYRFKKLEGPDLPTSFVHKLGIKKCACQSRCYCLRLWQPETIEYLTDDYIIVSSGIYKVLNDIPAGSYAGSGPATDPTNFTLQVGFDGEDKTYTHLQTEASMTWTVTHGLNKYPSVIVTNSDDVVMLAQITYNNLNQVTITVLEPTTGKAHFN